MNQHRVFISYAREQLDYAEMLFNRIEEVLIIPFMDKHSLESRPASWWDQVEQAIADAAYVALIVSPDALESETVARELDTARRCGTQIIRIQHPDFPDVYDSDIMNPWMKALHHYDLEHLGQWERFVIQLRSEPQVIPYVNRAPLPPDNFVMRQAEYGQAVAALLNGETTALAGAGGFGKTVLAQAISHDKRVVEHYYDGVLWVELGADINESDLLSKLNTLLGALGDVRRSEITDAQAALRDKLKKRRVLLVVDDVWKKTDIDAFREIFRYGDSTGGDGALLFTTRQARLVSDTGATSIDVDEMKTIEAVDLLRGSIADADNPVLESHFRKIAARLGEWPLLLGLAHSLLKNQVRRKQETAKDSPEKNLKAALEWLEMTLQKRGINYIRRDDEALRLRSAHDTLSISLEALAAVKNLKVFQPTERFAELAIFREEVVIPLSAVTTLWRLDDFDAEDILNHCVDFSLIRQRADGWQLHDLVREVMLSNLEDTVTVHSILVDHYGDLYNLPDSFAWQEIAYHLIQAGQRERLRSLLLSPTYLFKKLSSLRDPFKLLGDYYDYGRSDRVLELVRSAIEMSVHILVEHPDELLTQLYGRLLSQRDQEPEIATLLKSIALSDEYPALLSFYPSLKQVGGAVVRQVIKQDVYALASRVCLQTRLK